METWAALYHLGLRGVSADQVASGCFGIAGCGEHGLIFTFNDYKI